MFFYSGGPLWSVSELTAAIKDQLEESFPFVTVEGEVSNCRPSGAGHVYFTLKDSKAVLSAALFRGKAARAEIKPSDGMQVVATGKIDVYPPRGSYQLIVDKLRAAGRGALLEALEKKKKALAAEGLFDQERKKKLPPYPRHIAVITSPTGAAVQDILQVLSRRDAAPRITILPTAVQGIEAPEAIASQLKRAASYELGDVIILARGGGSLEDLAGFNDEKVVRCVAACPLPVISGVGHEIDVTLADLAADVRAATPSAAAELVSDRSEDLLLRAKGFRREAAGILAGRLEAAGRTIESLGPVQFLRLASRRLEEAMRQSDEARRGLIQDIADRLMTVRRGLDLAVRSLTDASPTAILQRGYTRIQQKGRTISDTRNLEMEHGITIQFAQGWAEAQVTKIEHEKEE